METLMVAWGSSQAWWGTACSIVVIANALTMALKDEYAEKLPILGKIWPIMNLSLIHISEPTRPY